MIAAPALPYRAPAAEPPTTGRSRPYTAVVLAVVLAVLPFAVIQSPAASLLRRAGVLARPDSFTELYFPDPALLPTRPLPAITFTFAIHNLQQRPMTYTWTADATVTGGTTSLGRGAAPVAPGATATISVSAPLPAWNAHLVGPFLPAPTRVRVTLQHPAQSIDFIIRQSAR